MGVEVITVKKEGKAKTVIKHSGIAARMAPNLR
jgi:hypothetical protein